MRLIDYYDKYVSLGLKPIAVFKGSKKPVCQGWNDDWAVDRWRGYFETEEYNIGILLGDVVDIEGDTEEANDLLERMIDGVSCPKFRSSRSVHYLFKNPLPELTRRVFDGIEFRAHRHQSVVPPSTHIDGTSYAWIEGSRFPLPQMPEELLAFYKRNSASERKNEQAAPRRKRQMGKEFTKTHCNRCRKTFVMHKKRLILEVRAFRGLGLTWACRSCRELDVREECRRLKRR